MTALAEPPHRWNAKTATAEALGTLRPAGYRKGRWLVKADAARSETLIGFQIADLCAFFQERFSGCRVRSSDRESGMREYRDLLAACRALPENAPVDIEDCLSHYRGKHKGLQRRRYRRRQLVWATTGGRCIYCCQLVDFSGLEAFHVDHFVPRSAGGSDRLENLVPACSFCNLSKGARHFHDWRALS